MCLKLHLAFHLGLIRRALLHKELKTFARNIFKPDGPEISTRPDGSHAIDPGSKVLEIVSMQQVLNNIFGLMELNLPSIILRSNNLDLRTKLQLL